MASEGSSNNAVIVNSVNNGITLPIVFENTNKYVYYGANLQEGDYEGVCFVYPQIVWYYFGKYFTNHVSQKFVPPPPQKKSQYIYKALRLSARCPRFR